MTIASAAEIVVDALRQVGAIGVYETAASAAETTIALRRLQYLINEMVATLEIPFYEPPGQRIPIVPGTRAYRLNATLNPRLQYIHQAFLLGPNNRRDPLDLLTVDEYATWVEDAPRDVGRPYAAFIERNDDPTMFLLRAPATPGWSIELWGRSYAGDVRQNQGGAPTGFSDAWMRCLVNLLAADLGSGSITYVERSRRLDWKQEGEAQSRLLAAYNLRPNETQPRFTEADGLY